MFYYPYQVRAIDICNPEHSFFVSKLNGITYELKREDEVQEVSILFSAMTILSAVFQPIK